MQPDPPLPARARILMRSMKGIGDEECLAGLRLDLDWAWGSMEIFWPGRRIGWEER